MKEEILALSRQYFEAHHRPKEFVPGQTYVPVTAKVMSPRDLEMLMEASLDMWLTAGRFSNEFEDKISGFFARKTKGLLVNSGSSANLVAVSSLGSPQLEKFGLRPLQKGDEVLTVAAGFPTTVNPIFQNGWKPVFVDVDPTTLNATVENLKKGLTSRTRAVVLAHTLGNPYRADEVKKFCDEHDLFLVEDCCDALGASVQGQPVGSFGHFATLSFYPAHHITMGEGGAVIPADGRLRRIAESYRDWGRDCWCEPGKDNTCKKRYGWQLGDLPFGYDHKYTYSHVGYNLKVTDMQAAVGLSQLERVEDFVAARRRNWSFLNEAVRSSRVLREKLTPVAPTAGTEPSWFGFPLHCRTDLSREKIVARLEELKVGTRLVFAGNLTRQPAYKGLEFDVAEPLLHTDAVMKHTFWIGVHPALDERKLDYMVSALEKTLAEQG